MSSLDAEKDRLPLKKKRVGLIGARGYVGRELLKLIQEHDFFELALASSRQLVGQKVFESEIEDAESENTLRYVEASPLDVVNAELDVVVLALPNDKCAPFVAAFSQDESTILIDLSADYRFDERWTYGSPERNAAKLTSSKRISNPGCYATAMQLLLAPFVAHLNGTPSFFGVSGYSGAGTSPSRSNDIEVLQDNLLAYKLTGHIHEREVAHQLQCELRFSPHVAVHFRGIHMTAHLPIVEGSLSSSSAAALLAETYAGSAFVEVIKDVPELKDVANTHLCRIGGVQVQGNTLVAVSVVDNLLKGAASQAMQNMNLACGFAETLGLYPKDRPAS